MAGATTAYRGKKHIVNANAPGIAATVYFVHKLIGEMQVSGKTHANGNRTHSEINAALPSTVRRTAKYKVVPQNQCPESSPVACLRSPQNKMIEKPKRT